MSPERQAVIFDWNGTVIDDAKQIYIAANKVLYHFGLPEVTMQKYLESYIVPIRDTYIALGLTSQQVEEQSEDIVSVWTSAYEEECKKLDLREGARFTLDYLKEAGHKTAVLSNYVVEKIQMQAKRFELHEIFDAILANECLARPMKNKEKGDRLKAFVADHQIERALVVGDTAEEIEIAHDYGYLGVAITGGTATVEALKASKPDFLIDSLNEIPTIAQKVFGRAAV